MKHMRKLLAMLLVIALVASMVPAVFAADNDPLAGYDLTSQPEGIDDSALDAVWAEIDTMYDRGEAITWSAAELAKKRLLKEWGFFWDPERQCERIGLK